MHSKRVFQMWRANGFVKCERSAKRESRTLGMLYLHICVCVCIYREGEKYPRQETLLSAFTYTQKSFTQYNSNKKESKKKKKK